MARRTWLPLGVLAAAAIALLFVAFKLHTTPSYGPETDLIGDLIPAARSLRAGQIIADNYQFKGPGYPLLLAVTGAALGGDDWVAARLVNVASAVAGAWFVFLIAERFLSAGAGLFVMIGLFASPIWLRAAIEAGTDMPAFAISMASTWLVLTRPGRGSWLLAGLLAGCSFLTRYNAIALVPAAVVAAIAGRDAGEAGRESWASRGGRVAIYVAGFAAVAGAWALLSRLRGTGVMQNRNYLNVAYEIYGQGMSWDNYWSTAAQQFHSLIEVLRFDPSRVTSVLSWNLATRWWSDIHELMPSWVGIPAVLGMAVAWPRRPWVLAIAAHFLFAYLVLAGVFYAQRFFLYLIPFYLMGAAALLFHFPTWPWTARRSARATPPSANSAARSRRRAKSEPAARGATRAPAPRVTPGRSAWLPWALGAGLILSAGWVSVAGVGKMLRAEPYETRDAGELLKGIAPPGSRVIARKPHVAYFAGMEYVPMPQVETIGRLLGYAAERKADYLLFTALEASLRGQFLLLADADVSLPGLVQIAHRVYPSRHYYSLYRFTKEPIDTARFAQAVLDRSTEFAARNPRDPQAQTFVGALLFDYGHPREALRFLEKSYRLNPSNAQTVGIMALCYFAVGDDVRAGEFCDAAMRLTQVSASIHALQGLSRAAAGRWGEAREIFQLASSMEPTNPRLSLLYAVTLLSMGDREAGERELDRCVALAPGLGAVREKTLRAFAGGGRPELGLALLHRLMRSLAFPSALEDLARDWPG